MEIINSIFSWIIKKRIHQIELFRKYPLEVQEELFASLINTAKKTEIGKQYDFASIKTVREFKERVPIQDYDGVKGTIQRLIQGEQNLTWPSEIKWFAKSSGTTSDKSKFIPVSKEALDDCHYKCGKDLLSLYYNQHPESKLLSGRSLVMGGSSEINQFSADSYYGDLSAIIIKNLPIWAELHRTPKMAIALMPEWEEKIEKMARITIKQNVTNLAGVPSWTMVLLKRVLEITGKDNIMEVWPNLELYVHGGVSFKPYREQYNRLIDPSRMKYRETYNASEGFFGIQDLPDSDSMLLMLDYGIFYEFLPMDQLGKEDPQTLSLNEVELNTNYALVISTNAGLWRYMVGDTIMFTSLSPARIKVTGRTKHFINAFGEELIIDNAENALGTACEKTGAIVKEYTAGPVYMEGESRGGHEWLIEFEQEPASLEYFKEVLDNALKSINSDYEAKRYKNLALDPPQIHAVPPGTFYNWMRSRGKLGGQHKVPRLANDRAYVDSILEILGGAQKPETG